MLTRERSEESELSTDVALCVCSEETALPAVLKGVADNALEVGAVVPALSLPEAAAVVSPTRESRSERI